MYRPIPYWLLSGLPVRVRHNDVAGVLLSAPPRALHHTSRIGRKRRQRGESLSGTWASGRATQYAGERGSAPGPNRGTVNDNGFATYVPELR